MVYLPLAATLPHHNALVSLELQVQIHSLFLKLPLAVVFIIAAEKYLTPPLPLISLAYLDLGQIASVVQKVCFAKHNNPGLISSSLVRLNFGTESVG